MRDAATVDSYQGKEADVICVVMGTTSGVGCGFTRDPTRLK